MDEGLDAAGDQPAPELIRQFALFRDAQADTAAAFDQRETRLLRRLQGDERLGLIVSQARSVAVTASLKVLAVPGRRGAFLVISTVRPDGKLDVFGGGAPLEPVLNGSPILTSGATIFGLAADGVKAQPVSLADGSTIGAPVVSNVYVVNDPSWSSPVFVDGGVR